MLLVNYPCLVTPVKNDSFSVDVIKRILEVLSNEGNTKRTSLAGKTGLNYSALIRYVDFLKMLKWVDFTGDSGNLISITTIGRSFKKILEREEGPEGISEEVLEKLMAQSQTVSRTLSKEEASNRNQSCLFCGNIIKKHAVTREVEGKKYSFDKSQCATLFMKLRDVYGREFLL